MVVKLNFPNRKYGDQTVPMSLVEAVNEAKAALENGNMVIQETYSEEDREFIRRAIQSEEQFDRVKDGDMLSIRPNLVGG